MATLQQLGEALKNAHNAGDFEAASLLAAEINKQIGRVPPAAPAEPEPIDRTLMGQAGELFRGVPRGIVSLLETAGVGASALLPEGPEEAVRAFVERTATGAAAPFQPKPGYEDSLAGTVGEVLGSTLPFFGTAAIPSAAARIATGLGLGSAAGAGEARTRAEAAGATEEERARATVLGVLPGAAEMVAPTAIVGRFLRLRNAVGPDVATSAVARLQRVALAAGEEGAQEAASEIAQNLIARGVYDPEQGVFTNTGESFGLGAGVGGLVAGLMELAIPGRARDVEPPPAVEPPAAERPAAVEQLEEPPVVEGTRLSEEDMTQQAVAPDVTRQLGVVSPTQFVGEEEIIGAAPVTRESVELEGETGPAYGGFAPRFTPISAAAEQESTITPEYIGSLGVDYRARSWVNENLIGKTAAQVQQMVEANPSLVTQPGKRSELLQAILATPPSPTTTFTGTPATPETAPGVATVFEPVEATPETAPGVAVDERARQGVPVTPETAPGVAVDEQARQGVPVTPETAPDVAAMPVVEEVAPIAQEATTRVPGVDGEPRFLSRAGKDTTQRFANVDDTTVFYHATDAEFDAFDLNAPKKNRAGNVAGVYFNPNKNRVKEYGKNVKEAKLKLGNVWLRTGGNQVSPQMLNAYREALIESGYRDNAWTDGLVEDFAQNQQFKDGVSGELRRRVLLAGGYDTYADGVRQNDKGETELGDIVVLRPENIEVVPTTPRAESQTIEVDGKQRPTTNSNGQPIHPTEEGIRNFWKWFGDSKVVDEQGRPLVVYHGTSTIPENSSTISTKQARGSNRGAWFGSASTANMYARGSSANVNPVYLSIRNPTQSLLDWNNDADGKFDGFVGEFGPNQPVYAVRNNTQIKSAIGNQGAFDPATPSIIASVNEKSDNNRTTEYNTRFVEQIAKARSTQELLGVIANDKTVPIELRNLARAFRSAAPNINVPIEMVEMEGADVVGEYMPPEKGRERIMLDPRADSVLQTYLHEMVHPLTYRAIATNSPAGRRVTQLYEQYKKQYPDTIDPTTGESKPFTYGMKNAYEFVAEGLTNQKFQTLLKKQGWWNRFVDAIRRALGLPDSQQQIVNELLDLTKEMAVGANARAIRLQNELADAMVDTDTREGNIRFARALDGIIKEAVTSPTSKKAQRFSLDAYTYMSEKAKKTLLWGLHMNSINDLVSNIKTAPKEFKDAVSAFNDALNSADGSRNQFVISLEPVINRAKKYVSEATPEMIEAFDDLVFKADEAQIDLRYDESRYAKNPEKLAAYKALVENEWGKVGPQGQQLYRQMRTMYDKQFRELVTLIKSGVTDMSGGDKTLTTAVTNLFMKELESGALEGYAPHLRPNGDWALTYFTSIGGKPPVMAFHLFTSKAQRDEFALEIESDPNTVKGTVQKPANLGREIEQIVGNAPANSFVNQVLKTLNENNASQEVKQSVLQAALAMSPSRSLATRLAHRKNTPGFERDAFKAFNNSMLSVGRSIENLKSGAQTNKALQQIKESYKAAGSPEELRPIVLELAERANFATNPQLPAWSNWAKTLTFAWTLGLNTSSPIVDLSSLALVTYSHLSSRYGAVKSAKAMRNAVRTIMGGGTSADIESYLTKDISDLADTAVQEELGLAGLSGRDKQKTRAFYSILNYDFENKNLPKKTARLKYLADELSRLGHSQRFSDLSETLELGESTVLSKVNAYMGILMHASERFKREVGTVSQFELEVAAREAKGEALTEEVLKEIARKAVSDSIALNGGSSSLTKPRFTQGPISSVLMMYKQYGAAQYYLQFRLLSNMLRTENDPAVRKTARNQLIAMVGASALFAGVRGLPMMGVAMWVANMFLDDEEEDAEAIMRRTIGTGFTEGVVNAMFNMNVGPRIELTNMMFRDTNLPDSASFADQMVAHLGGPAFGSLTRFIRGVELIQEGRFERGIESMLPIPLANLMKTERFAREGATTLRGDPVIAEMTPGALFSQALGFAPADYARASAFTTKQSARDRRITTARNRLYERAYLAYRTGDTQGYLEVIKDIAEFNEKHPNLPITNSSLQQSRTTRDRNTEKMIMGRLPGAGFEGRWQEEAAEWGFGF